MQWLDFGSLRFHWKFSILAVLRRSLSNGAVAVRLTAPAIAPARRYFRSVGGIITSPSILSPVLSPVLSSVLSPVLSPFLSPILIDFLSLQASASFAALHEKVGSLRFFEDTDKMLENSIKDGTHDGLQAKSIDELFGKR
ncbi:20290_t:CDS:2 [Rhizophagus irregularis]|nr:20290_t:CDS:2 [Rhizophagus irregularis]